MKWLGFLLLIRTVCSAPHNADENVGVNNKKLFEGDMRLTDEQVYNAEHGLDVDSTRKRGSIALDRLWRNAMVPYDISSSLSGSPSAFAAIRAALGEWTSKTCLRFKRRTSEGDYVRFARLSNRGCSSFIGRTGSRQDISLETSGCWFKGIVAHEIGHAIGFFHEQSRPDRDDFITVKYENIQTGRENNFLKYSRSVIDSLGTPYDYGSLMHYGDKAFSKNERPTIVVKQAGAEIGQRRGLSTIDAQQANLLYERQCNQRGEGDVCSNYQVLSSADRSQTNDVLEVSKCDQRDLPEASGWYRFMGPAGNGMPDQCVPVGHCGTHAPGWLNGANPSVQDGIVTRQVCYNWNNNCCRWSNNVRVKNCGDYFVYELHWATTCNLRYCGNGQEPVTLPPTTRPAPTTEPVTLPPTTRPAPTTESCKDQAGANLCSNWKSFFGCSWFVPTYCKKSCDIC